jgi:hypothetical protein
MGGYGIYTDEEGNEHQIPVKVKEDGTQYMEIEGLTIEIDELNIDVETLATESSLTALASDITKLINQNSNKDSFDQTDLVANVYTSATDLYGVTVINEGATSITVTIGTNSFPIAAGRMLSIKRKTAFTTVTFSAGATVTAYTYG